MAVPCSVHRQMAASSMPCAALTKSGKGFACAVVLHLLTGLAAVAFDAEVKGYYWLMAPEGEAAVSLGSLQGSDVDIRDDLGYDDKAVLGLRALLGGSFHQLGVDYFALDLSAQNTIQRDIRFADLVFRVAEEVASELQATMVRGYYRLNAGSDQLRGGFLVGFQYLSMEVHASSSSVGSASASGSAGSPVVGGHLAVQPVTWFLLEGSLLGANWDLGGIEATYFDFEVSGSIVLPPGFLLGGGYRRIDVDASYDRAAIDTDLTLSGPMLFAGFQW